MWKKLSCILWALGITGFFLSAPLVQAMEKPWDREEWILSLENSPASEKRLQDWCQLIRKESWLIYEQKQKLKFQDWCVPILKECMEACLLRAMDEGSLWAGRQLRLENRKYAPLSDDEYCIGVSGLKYLPPVQQKIRIKWEKEGRSVSDVVPLSHSWINIEKDFHKDEGCWNGRRHIVDRMPSLVGRFFGGSESQTWKQIVESHIRVNLVPWIGKGSMKAGAEALDLSVDPISVVKGWQKDPDHQAILKRVSIKKVSQGDYPPFSLSKEQDKNEKGFKCTKMSQKGNQWLLEEE